MSNLRSHLTKSDFILIFSFIFSFIFIFSLLISFLLKMFFSSKNKLILFLLFIGIGITVWIYYPKSTPASTVEVRENGKLILSLPLSENTKQTIRCTDGGSNQLLIQDGAVTMTDADCDDKTCVKTGSIKENGQSIVCLPHRLVITITDSSSDSAPDAIVR